MAQDRPAEQGQPREADRPDEAQPQQTDLPARLERLPIGHPSSPYRDDGSRQPPPPDLSKYELPLPDESGSPADPDLADNIESLTDAEYAEHVREARDRLNQARADGLESDRQYTIDPDREVWSEHRVALHDEIINKLYARGNDVPNEHRAVIAGGPPGAGKTTILDGHTDIDRSRFLTIDPDEIKKELAQRGLVPPIEGLSPMEASGLVHEESSYIARQLAYRSQAVGKNVIWDITMSSRSTTERRIDELRSAGYTHIEGIFVEIPLETSQTRTEARHRIAHDEYRAGKGLGGRLVPPEVTYDRIDPTWGSINRRTFEEVKHRFDRWSVYDNSTDGGSPILVDSAEKRKLNDQ